MSRRRRSAAEDFVDLLSRLPWWLCLLMGALGWAVFSWIASRPISPPAGAAGHLPGVFLRGVATAAQYIVPILCIGAGFVSVFRRRRGAALLEEAKAAPARSTIDGMSWADFERLVGALFRDQGYRVVETGGGGVDGGVDLVLGKGGEKFFVQCKQWRAYKVGVSVVRELYGVMAARGAVGGFVVTSGTFTDEAVSFAQGRNVTLLDGVDLGRFLASPSARPNSAAASTEAPASRPVTDIPDIGARAEQEAPACPSCGAPMLRRVAKRGANAGGAFWGCSTYPRCRGTRALG